MNIFYKLYCRTFQKCLHIALPFLPYKEPKVINCEKDILNIVQDKTVLLVTDKMLRRTNLTSSLEQLLKENGNKVIIYEDTRVNPSVKNVEEAFGLYKKNNCEAIIAMGGGSSIDLAKGVGSKIAYPHKSLNQMAGILKVLRKTPLLIAIPTTAGTGSETTVTAVITDEKIKHKYTINSFPLCPDYALLNPEYTYSLPKHLTAGCGMDVLCHAIEAYIGKSTIKLTRRMALEAAKLVFDNLEIAYNKPDNYNARNNMLIASYKAGIAFSRSYVGYIHAIAHTLGGQYGIAHGHANAIIMPLILEGYGSCVYKKLKELAVYCNLCAENTSTKMASEILIGKIRKMNKDMNIPTLTCIEEKDIDKMAKYALAEANPLYPVPRIMDLEEIKAYYYKLMEN